MEGKFVRPIPVKNTLEGWNAFNFFFIWWGEEGEQRSGLMVLVCGFLSMNRGRGVQKSSGVPAILHYL